MAVSGVNNVAAYMANQVNATKNKTGKTEGDKDKDKVDKTQPDTTNRTLNDNTMDMEDFMKLLAIQLQNQDMMNPMKESEFMNQMVQMASITAMSTMTDVTKTTYAASLVGKEVTVADLDDNDEVVEIFGTVTGAGLYGGQQIIFVKDKSYYLSQIMVVGKLPPKKDDPEIDNSLPGEGDGEGDGTVPPPGEGDGTVPPPGEGDGTVPPPDTNDPPKG